MRLETVMRLAERELGSLEASHKSTGRSLEDFEVYRDRPVAFLEEVLGAEPWAIQRAIAEAVQEEHFVAVQSCNSLGKDWLAARLALWWVYARRGLVLVTGPTDRQVKEVVMRTELRQAFRRVPDLPGDLYASTLRVEGAGGIVAMTSADPSRLTGFHDPRGVLAVVTEAQGCEGLVFEAILANTTGDEDAVLAVGNPLAPSGRFYEICRSGRWRTFQVSAFDHPNLVEDREVIPGAVTRRFVEMMKAEYGESSSIYRSRVLGEWPTDDEEALVKLEWLEAAAEAWAAWEAGDRFEGGGIALGVDIARFGSDSTVVAVRRGTVLAELEKLPRGSTMETTGRVVRKLEELSGRQPGGEGYRGHPVRLGQVKAVRAVVDEVGLGASVVDRLEELGWGEDVFGFNSSFSAEGPRADRFLNLRAQSYWRLRELLEKGAVAIPEHEELWEELQATRWTVHSSGSLKIESKDLIRSTIGRSPDFADAVAMAFWQVEGAGSLPRLTSVSYASEGGATFPVLPGRAVFPGGAL